MNRLPFLLALATLSAPGSAQLVISEVLADPVGPNFGNQVVELINVGNTPFDPTGWAFCIRPSYPPMPSIVIPPGGIVTVHFGTSGTNTVTDWFLPFQQLGTDGELALYSTTFILLFGSPTLIQDFVSWGNGATPAFNSRIDVAVAAGIWPSITSHVALPPEGASVSWFGAGNGPDAWFVDSTPTLGAPNRPARLETFGMGCAGSAGVPDLALNHLPWLGENFRVDLTNLPPGNGLAIMITSFTETPAQSLAAFGMPGCSSYLTTDLTSLLFTTGGAASFGFTLPTSPVFEGVVFLEQAFVVDPAAGNALGATVSNPVRATVGQR